MADKFLRYRKAVVATVGAVASVLLATGNLGVQDVNTVWPIISAFLTAVTVAATPNKTP
jgi:hypothetical protein